MANKKGNNSINLGEITTIRNILMGQQMNDYDNRFESVQENLNALEASLNEKIDLLEKNNATQMQNLKKEMSNRFDNLEQLVISNVEDLNKKIDQVTGNDRTKMGQLFAEMSKRLLE